MATQPVDLLMMTNVGTVQNGAWYKIARGGTYLLAIEASAFGGGTARLEREGPAGEGTGAAIPDTVATFTANGVQLVSIGSGERIRIATITAAPTALYARLRLVNG